MRSCDCLVVSKNEQKAGKKNADCKAVNWYKMNLKRYCE